MQCDEDRHERPAGCTAPDGLTNYTSESSGRIVRSHCVTRRRRRCKHIAWSDATVAGVDLAENLANKRHGTALYTFRTAEILWRTIARKTPYCTANAASFAPTEPTEMNHAQVMKSKRKAMNRLVSPNAASKAAQA